MLFTATLSILAQPSRPTLTFHALRVQKECMNIYTMELDGNGIRQLTNNPWWHDAYPDWSPDGKEIVFRSRWDLAIMNWDGSNYRR